MPLRAKYFSIDSSVSFLSFSLQAMLGELRTMSSRFSRKLYRNLCIRILQRRDVMSRTSRLLRKRGDERTKLDRWLDDIRDQVIAEGREKVYKTFLDSGEIEDEVARFEELSAARVNVVREDLDTMDDYEAFKDADEDDDGAGTSTNSTSRPTAKELLELHVKGFRTLPERLTLVLSTLQPTSVAAERSFSRARHARRYKQERLLDDRFANFMLLKDFYRKSQPWITSPRRITFLHYQLSSVR